jgi:hypothetical protein
MNTFLTASRLPTSTTTTFRFYFTAYAARRPFWSLLPPPGLHSLPLEPLMDGFRSLPPAFRVCHPLSELAPMFRACSRFGSLLLLLEPSNSRFQSLRILTSRLQNLQILTSSIQSRVGGLEAYHNFGEGRINCRIDKCLPARASCTARPVSSKYPPAPAFLSRRPSFHRLPPSVVSLPPSLSFYRPWSLYFPLRTSLVYFSRHPQHAAMPMISRVGGLEAYHNFREGRINCRIDKCLPARASCMA